MINTIWTAISQYPLIISFICGELFLLLARNQDITNMFKSDNQRSLKEKSDIEDSLRLKLILETILFLPARVIIFRLTVFPLLYTRLLRINTEPFLWYAIMGIVAYAIPLKWLFRLFSYILPESFKYFLELMKKDLENT